MELDYRIFAPGIKEMPEGFEKDMRILKTNISMATQSMGSGSSIHADAICYLINICINQEQRISKLENKENETKTNKKV